MRVLMLGWEFPPFIAGGLGVACHGLTKALDRMGHEVLFVLPRTVEGAPRTHVRLLSPGTRGHRLAHHRNAASEFGHGRFTMPGFPHTVFRGVGAAFTSPYPTFTPDPGRPVGAKGDAPPEGGVRPEENAPVLGSLTPAAHSGSYSGDLIGDADRYARLVVSLARGEAFDVIHAHDWLTYPAGLALARVSRRPLVVHVHSTEFDRAGDNINQGIYDIERRGLQGAQRIIAVSMLTKSMCVGRYGVRPGKVDVVYNGIDREAEQPAPGARIASHDKIVLFLGRITMQKGPEYFIGAAKRVLEKIDHVKFVVAGAGDMAAAMIEHAAALGIGAKVLFTGFLRGRDVERIYRMADCYVMPSVSEPFGIAPLEAIHNGVPVIISKQSGVSEVLSHVLKVDFWDVDEMANKIVAVLRHPPLGATMREHGEFELRRLTWEGAAEKCLRSYHKAAEAIAPA